MKMREVDFEEERNRNIHTPSTKPPGIHREYRVALFFSYCLKNFHFGTFSGS